VLDVGCGPGHLTSHLRSLDVEATGIDLVPELLNHARGSYPDGRFELASIHRLPVPDSSIAGILAWYSLIHVPPDDLDGVLGDLRRDSPGSPDGVHGRLDVSSPVDSAWRLHQAWPDSELIIVDDEGHGGETMTTHCRAVLADLAEPG